MKRIGLILLTVILVALPAFSQIVEIPDTAFLYALIEEGVDTNGDSLVSYAEAETVTELILSWTGGYGGCWDSSTGIESYTGIEAFINLTIFSCPCGEAESLNLSNNHQLLELDCSDNNLLSINVTGLSQLTELDCSGNKITSLDISYDTSLIYLDCHDNRLLSLDISMNTMLERLVCGQNQLSRLDISNNSNIYWLGIEEMPTLHEVCTWTETFQSSDVYVFEDGSPNVYFTTECGATFVNIPDSAFLHALINEGVDSNGDSLISYSEAREISTLEIWPEQGYSGCVENSNITNYTGIETFSNLDTLILTCGMADSLDLSGNLKLKYLDCSRNQLTTLDISNNTQLSELALVDLPRLSQVCVWELPFPHVGLTIDTTGSPHLYFTTDCTLRFVNVPDTALLYSLIDADVDINGDSLISNREAEVFRSMNISNSGISSLTGIEAFINLDSLDCHANSLSSINSLRDLSLSYLDCSENLISELTISFPASLSFLNCSNNLFEWLCISEFTALKWLDISHMPTLKEVCVWTIPFPPAGIIIDTSASTNMFFTNLCECVGDQFEDNDHQENAFPIDNNHSYENLFVSKGDDDWYKISIDYYYSSAHEMTVNCNFNQSDGDINIELLDTNGTILVSSENDTDNEILKYPAGPYKTYYLRVYLSSGARNSYSLESILPPPPTFQFHPHSISFGEVDIYRTHYEAIEVINLGDHPLIIDSICTDMVGSRINPPSSVIESGETSSFKVDLFTRYMEPFQGILTFYTDDSAYQQIQLPISGEGTRIAEFALLYQIADTVSVGYWNSHIIPFPNPSTNSNLTLVSSIVTYSLPEEINDQIPREESEIGSWATTSLDEFTVLPPGGNTMFGITLDGSGMELGDYYADVILEWYNPEYHKGLIPIRLHVKDTLQNIIANQNTDDLLIYPNPTNDLLYLQTRNPGSYTIELISLNGKIIERHYFEGTTHQIDLSSFAKGVYFITVRSKDFVTTKKIIKL